MAILTTKRRLDSASILFASSSPASALLAYSNSSSDVSKLIRPISFKYILTGSLILTSFVSVRFSTDISSVISSPDASSLPSSDTMSILFSTKKLYNSSRESLSTSNPFN